METQETQCRECGRWMPGDSYLFCQDCEERIARKNLRASASICGKTSPVATNPEKDAERIEADLLAEEAGGKPINYGSTAKAIAALEERITHLTERYRKLETKPGALEDVGPQLIREIRQAEADLASYRRQHEGRN